MISLLYRNETTAFFRIRLYLLCLRLSRVHHVETGEALQER
jgi:hypothetical protein